MTQIGWITLILGCTVNILALVVMVPEIIKEVFRFSELPVVSSMGSFLQFVKSLFTLAWLPEDALHIHYHKKIVFAAIDGIFFFALVFTYRQGKRQLALGAGLLALLTIILLFSPIVGNL